MTECLLLAKIKALAASSGASLNKAERDLVGYPRNELSNYNHVKKPSAERILELSAYFGVSPEYLMDDSLERMIYSIPRLFDHLNNEQKEEMYRLAQRWSQGSSTYERGIVELSNSSQAY